MTEHTSPASTDNSLAITSMVLGIVSLTGFGLILGIPAIVLGIIALKKKAANRGLSITGIVTGAISTLLSLLLIAFFVFMVIFAASQPNDPSSDYSDTRPSDYYHSL